MEKKISCSPTVRATILLAVIGLIAGCSTAPPASGTATAPGQPAKTGGTQLWAQNCGHCHNLRSPSSYSDAQWDVVALHMRVRANLTADEHRKILAFLKSAH
jgi:cytochrome c553